MTIKINCDRCHGELNEPGALLFSPPDEKQRADKYHVCEPCWRGLLAIVFWLNRPSPATVTGVGG